MPPSAIRGLSPSKRRCQTTHDQAPPLSTGSGYNASSITSGGISVNCVGLARNVIESKIPVTIM